MADIYVGFAIVTALSIAAFAGGLRITRSASSVRPELLGMLVLALMAWYVVHLWHNIRMLQLLPFSNVIVLGNWFPPAAGFLAGLAWRRIEECRNRRSVVIGSLAAASLYSMVHPLLGEQPACGDLWRGNVCIQTSDNSCSAASAATLLRAYGIEATEAEMAQLCLTRRGTTWAGLYRGLKRKTEGTRWDVELFQSNLQELEENLSEPVILSVGLNRNQLADPNYVQDWGMIPGQPHSVVLFRFLASNAAVMGDPAVGRELWSRRDLEYLWHGEGIRLVKRTDAPHVAVHDVQGD